MPKQLALEDFRVGARLAYDVDGVYGAGAYAGFTIEVTAFDGVNVCTRVVTNRGTAFKAGADYGRYHVKEFYGNPRWTLGYSGLFSGGPVSTN